jgi:hypothetical protein
MKIDISQAYLYGVTDEAALELVEWRKSIRKPLTQRAFERALKEAVKCTDLGITADRAIEIAIDKGWQGVTLEYVKAELERRGEAANRQQLVLHKPEDMQGFVSRVTDRGWSH